MLRFFLISVVLLYKLNASQAQVNWVCVDSLYQPLPSSFHIYKTTDSLDGKPNTAYYIAAKLKDKELDFTTDTAYKRRLTPLKFFEKNNQPLLVVNCTFFSFQTNQNLNVVIKEGRLTGYNIHSIAGRGKDTFTWRHPLGSAIGINKKREADIAWVFTDSSQRYAYGSQFVMEAFRDSVQKYSLNSMKKKTVSRRTRYAQLLKKWKMETAAGGGPVLLQRGELQITNNEELKFAGKAIDDKHPRTAMGYTADGHLVVMVVQGRFPGTAEGASLTQLANLMKQAGCTEALNLDGGGSSCMLVNGKETIKPSDKEGQRPVPAVFMIKRNR